MSESIQDLYDYVTGPLSLRLANMDEDEYNRREAIKQNLKQKVRNNKYIESILKEEK